MVTKPPASDSERANMLLLFFLGVVSYYRLLQTGVEDVIYARAMSKIQEFYSAIDSDHAPLFNVSSVDQVGLSRLGMFRLWWWEAYSLPSRRRTGCIPRLLFLSASDRFQRC